MQGKVGGVSKLPFDEIPKAAIRVFGTLIWVLGSLKRRLRLVTCDTLMLLVKLVMTVFCLLLRMVGNRRSPSCSCYTDDGGLGDRTDLRRRYGEVGRRRAEQIFELCGGMLR